MRRVVVLVLVVGLCSGARGTVVSVTSGGSSDVQVASAGDAITVDLTVDFACSGIYQVDFVSSGLALIEGVGSWVSPMDTYGGGAADNGTLQGGNIMDAYGETLNGATDVSAGTVLYSFDVTVNGDGAVVPQMSVNDFAFQTVPPYGYDGSQLTMSDLTVSIVPEPITIALLGLGCLFVRRRG